MSVLARDQPFITDSEDGKYARVKFAVESRMWVWPALCCLAVLVGIPASHSFIAQSRSPSAFVNGC
jgi:hypothetical protein